LQLFTRSNLIVFLLSTLNLLCNVPSFSLINHGINTVVRGAKAEEIP